MFLPDIIEEIRSKRRDIYVEFEKYYFHHNNLKREGFCIYFYTRYGINHVSNEEFKAVFPELYKQRITPEECEWHYDVNENYQSAYEDIRQEHQLRLEAVRAAIEEYDRNSQQ